MARASAATLAQHGISLADINARGWRGLGCPARAGEEGAWQGAW